MGIPSIKYALEELWKPNSQTHSRLKFLDILSIYRR